MNLFGEQQVVDLTVLIGSYVTVSMVLNVGEVEIPGNATPPLAPMSDPFPPEVIPLSGILDATPGGPPL
jgi:hypothetical protein